MNKQKRPALEALDDPRLPQRPRPVERRAVDAADHRAQLLLAPGGRQRHVTHVVDDVEVGVVHPQRVMQVERHVHQPARSA
jgi:hypothetical protein